MACKRVEHWAALRDQQRVEPSDIPWAVSKVDWSVTQWGTRTAGSLVERKAAQ
jgi:hypothetical protein